MDSSTCNTERIAPNPSLGVGIHVIRTRCYGLVGAMIPSRLCCTGAGARPGAHIQSPPA